MNKVVKKDDSLPVSADYLKELEEDRGSGGKVTARDISIPYLVLLQAKSPQVDVENAKAIPGANATMVYLSIYEDLFNAREVGVPIIPCYFERVINEWVPRTQGGGLARTFPPESDIMEKAKPDDRGRMFLPNGNQLMETAYHYVLVQRHSGEWVPAIFAMQSTALKASRRWNFMIGSARLPNSTKNAPRPAYIYTLMTQREQRDTNVWSGPVILDTGKLTPEEIYRNLAKPFSQQAATGMLRRPMDEQPPEESNATEVI